MYDREYQSVFDARKYRDVIRDPHCVLSDMRAGYISRQRG
jgi:hypothetical protein